MKSIKLLLCGVVLLLLTSCVSSQYSSSYGQALGGMINSTENRSVQSGSQTGLAK